MALYDTISALNWCSNGLGYVRNLPMVMYNLNHYCIINVQCINVQCIKSP